MLSDKNLNDVMLKNGLKRRFEGNVMIECVCVWVLIGYA